MKQIKNRILHLSIRQKLIFYSYLIITPILLCISVLLLLYNYKAAVRSEEESCRQSVRQISDSIGVLQKNIMEMGTYICINEQIRQILTSDKPDEQNRDVRLWLHQAPMQMIQDMVAIDGEIKTIAVYPENGVNPYLKCIDRSSYLGDMDEIRRTKIYAKTVQEKGKFLWQRIGSGRSDTYQMNVNDKIVIYREIYDMRRQTKLGYLVIGSTAEIFDEVCRNALLDKKEAVLVVSEYGTELVRCGNIEEKVISGLTEGNTFKFTGGCAEGASDGKERISSSTWEDYRIYQCRNEETGTFVYMMASKVSIFDFADTIIYAPMALLLGFLVGLCPVMTVVSNIVSKPLHTLSVAMENFKKGDFSQKIDVVTMDEAGEAAACFNRMVDDMRELIDKNYVLAIRERESELDVLQAQINPHFLYNTLDSLYWKAIESGNEEMGEDIYSLSQLFRLVLNRGNGIVTVRIEAELLERYLHIQKMRFGRRLEYHISVDACILEEEIPKLILQPFVENAIVHGFEKVDSSYTLAVTGEKQEERMVFHIIDTGIGMSKKQVEAIWEKKDTGKYASQRIGRYAIKNVKERLELIYHENYELLIESKQGQGTTVVISIPCGLKEMRLHEHKTFDCG